MKNWCKILVLVFFGNSILVFSQDSIGISKVQKSVSKLKKAVDKNDNRGVANSYVNLGDDYFNQNNFAKSEEFYTKAKTIYQSLNDKKNLETISRKLAQSQERQNKITPAISNYSKAANYGISPRNRSINTNDVTRLSSPSKDVKSEAIQSNMRLAIAENDKKDLAESYSQMADVNLSQNNAVKAEENLVTAYKITKEEAPQQALQINKKLTDVYLKQNNFEKAIEVKKNILKEDFVKTNSQEKVNQIQELADIYVQKNDPKEAVNLFRNAYEIALQKGHTLEAQRSVKKLDSLYQTAQNTDASINLYRDFFGKLPNLVANDRSLVDNKILEDTEQRISQLEKEKQLKDELIRKKNIFNYSLIAAVVLLLLLTGFIFWTLRKVQIKNKKIALQSLRREMNPHFIFNSLNSVNQFIATNNELEANQYLTKFSKLMRGVMENSTEDFISFSQELDLLQNYLALEKTRFADKFDFEINIDESLKSQNIQIPGMLIQPFLENAIWHGLRYRSEKGFLKLNFVKDQNLLKITIEDNGIGIEESKKQKTEHQKQRQGRGMKNTLERIALLNDLYRKNIRCKIIDKPNSEGVLVSILLEV